LEKQEWEVIKRKDWNALRKALVERFQKAVAKAAEDCLVAERRRQENSDPAKAGEFLRACREAETALENYKEQLRVSEKVTDDLHREKGRAIETWKRDKKQSLLKDWQTVNASCDDQMLSLQKKRIEKANACLAKLHELDRSYPSGLSHGNPNFYLNGDILIGKRLPSIEISDTRAEFRWLELKTGIRN